MDLIIACVLFLLGLALGSFLNVCISRIPRDESIIAPPSHCRSCEAPIPWRDNIPLVSFLLLSGTCRACGSHISFRYPAVELLTAALFAACFVTFGYSWLTVKFCVFCFLLVGLIFMDAETGLLPREFTCTGIFLGLVFSWFALTNSSGTAFLLRLMRANVTRARELSCIDAALAALLGAAFFYLAWALYYLFRKQHGMGFGDIALIAMSGAFLGLKLTLFVIFSAPLLTLLYAVFQLLRERFGNSPHSAVGEATRAQAREKFLLRELPFGVFLGICSIMAVFFGEGVWRWYLHFFQR